MKMNAALTVRLPLAVKQRINARAKRERRSLSAQVVCELERATRDEPVEPQRPGKFLGRFPGGRVPNDTDFAEVRATLWGRLGRRDG